MVDKDIDELDDLSPCLDVTNLNLSNNKISDLEGISTLRDLTMLNLSNNMLDSLEGCKFYSKLKGTRTHATRTLHTQYTTYINMLCTYIHIQMCTYTCTLFFSFSHSCSIFPPLSLFLILLIFQFLMCLTIACIALIIWTK